MIHEPVDWSRVATAAQRGAEAGCRRVVHGGVDAATRRPGGHDRDDARRVDHVRPPLYPAYLDSPCGRRAAAPPADTATVRRHRQRTRRSGQRRRGGIRQRRAPGRLLQEVTG